MSNYQETVFNCSDQFFNQLITDIRQAKKSIEIEIYLFKFDNLGQKIINELINAAKRNVTIRILVDGIGSPNWKGSMVDMLDQNGIKSKIYHPLPWSLSQFNRSVYNKPWIKKILYFITNINSRNHRKVILIDNKILHIGSRNFDTRHLSLDQGGLNWRDTNIRLVNSPFNNLKNSLESAWGNQQIIDRIQQKIIKPLEHYSPIRLNDTRRQRRLAYKNLLKKISQAESKIWITNAYFIPNNLLLKKLIQAAQKKIDVRILLPHKSDVAVIPWISEFFYRKLIENGVRIFEYTPSMLHAKNIIIDNWVLIGTSNLNHRSLLHDLEVDVVVKLEPSKQKVIDQFHDDLSLSEEIKNPFLQRRHWLKRFIGRIIMQIKFFM